MRKKIQVDDDGKNLALCVNVWMIDGCLAQQFWWLVRILLWNFAFKEEAAALVHAIDGGEGDGEMQFVVLVWELELVLWARLDIQQVLINNTEEREGREKKKSVPRDNEDNTQISS